MTPRHPQSTDSTQPPYLVRTGDPSRRNGDSSRRNGCSLAVPGSGPSEPEPVLLRRPRRAGDGGSGSLETWASRHTRTMDATGRLAGGVAHHFNNLLTVVEANTGFVLDHVQDPHLRRELMEIRSVCRRAGTLTRHLLAISGRAWRSPRILDLRELVNELDLGRFVGGDVVFCTDLCSRPCRVLADPEQMEEVLFLLLLNAREAVVETGTIQLSVHHVSPDEVSTEAMNADEDGSWIRIELRDTGSGMDQATLSRAFEPFFSSRSECMERGLGLSVVYGIVTQNGGTMQIRSGPGEGTTVRVWLPAA